MTNSTILRNWEAILASLPPTTKVNAEFKMFELGTTNAKPDYSRFEFTTKTPPQLSLNGNHLERITASMNYRRGSYFYEVDVRLFTGGSVEIEMEYGPTGESPAKRCFPRFCPTVEELKECFAPTPAIFMEEWLTDFFTVIGNDLNFRGQYSIGGGGLSQNFETYQVTLPPTEIAAKLLAKAKRSSLSATAFEAVLERDNTTRSDFIDRITATVKPNRRVYIEYRTYERDGFYTRDRSGKPTPFSCTGPLVIGVAHEASDLELTSSIFPHGFAEREPREFLVRFNNFSEGTCEYREWPNRQNR